MSVDESDRPWWDLLSLNAPLSTAILEQPANNRKEQQLRRAQRKAKKSPENGSTRVNRWQSITEFLISLMTQVGMWWWCTELVLMKLDFLGGIWQSFGPVSVTAQSHRSKCSRGEASLRVTASTIKRISERFCCCFHHQERGGAVKRFLQELRPSCVFTTKAWPHSWKMGQVLYSCGSGGSGNQDHNSHSRAFLWHQELKGNTFAGRYAATWKRLSAKLLWARGWGHSARASGSWEHTEHKQIQRFGHEYNYLAIFIWPICMQRNVHCLFFLLLVSVTFHNNERHPRVKATDFFISQWPKKKYPKTSNKHMK